MKQALKCGCAVGALILATVAASAAEDDAKKFRTATPIKHLVVIFQENVSFDHYFGAYPVAKNTDGTTFTASSDTPGVNNLSTPLDVNNGFKPLAGVDLLGNNPNKNNSANARARSIRSVCRRRRRSRPTRDTTTSPNSRPSTGARWTSSPSTRATKAQAVSRRARCRAHR